MAAATVHVQREILAEPDAVWRIITDIDRADQVLSGVTRVERLVGEGYDVGVKWRETRRMLGKEASEDMWVTAVNEPFSTAVNAESSGTRYSTVFRCEPSDLGTMLHIEFSGRAVNPTLGQKLVWAIFGRVSMKASRQALTQDLADIARAAESV